MSWKSLKKDKIIVSITEAEYIVASNATKEVVRIKKFISELGIIHSIVDLMIYIVITIMPSQKLRTLDLNNDPNTYLGDIISFERL